ncbi:MAG: hypothetical protein ACJA2L_001287, partial [Polaribacter sp.]
WVTVNFSLFKECKLNAVYSFFRFKNDLIFSLHN